MASKSRRLPRLLLLGGGLAALAGCAGTPQPDAALTQAQAQVAAAANDANVVALAQPELQKAQAALQQSEAALRNDDMTAVDHDAYLATRYAATAEQMAKLKAAQRVVAQAPEARSAALTQAAQGQAAQAQAEAAAARAEAQQSQQQQQQAAVREEQMKREIAALQAKQTPEGLVVTPRDILFRPGSAELQPGGDASVQRIAEFLRGNPDRKVLVEGFTDSTGTAAENQQLSEQRADAVRLALANAGVNASRIEIRGMGAAQPLASNESNAGRLINRRVRIVISNANGAFPQATAGSSQP
jgi:outer membrane protein OmpA-like peptidoglycan-associated protein